MTVPASRVRRRPRTPGRMLPLLLATALLLPVAFLVVRAHQYIDADREVLERERLGVEYLRALGPVTEALVDAQSAAVADRQPPRENLQQAVERAAVVDARIGGELGTSERWAGIRAKLEALPERSLAPEAAFSAYREVTDLLLALHGKVRETSGLIRDSGAASYFLQDGVGEEMPEATVAAGRLIDVAVLAEQRPATERMRTLSELATLRLAALQPANDLVNNLRAVVDSSASADLGPSVLTPFDAFQRAVEAMAIHAQPDNRTGTVDVVRLTSARDDAQRASTQLQPILLDEIDRLLVERIDQLDRDDLLTMAAGGVAGLLLVALAASGWLSRPRDITGSPQAPDTESDEPEQPVGTRWEPIRSTGDRALEPVGHGHDPDRWRPFDAAR
ncbi:hypothetical protein [Micromonospora craniellae]|uniref:Nitrate/nitrite sensing protein domain-containing protein n=1 Tax=Micromonospora craniellae TaxID=2294034 RepID=A0A372FWU3_9ACTN|nr:hypothetical protein [Micromonospora craniellae]QOC90054.1 hypothetical protein ID554_17765 [Micromonospora craniellae]RFS45255.1 hypothetical protein D0Q02_17685 [Micromonospora craniellae]